MTSPTPPTPEELEDFRARLGWTQQTLADALGVTLRTAQAWLAGERTPPAFLRLAMERLEGPRDESG